MATLLPDGRIRTRVGGVDKTFPKGTSRRLVRRYEDEMRLKRIDRRLVEDETTVSAFVKHFLAVYPTMKRRSKSTLRRDEFTFTCHVIPNFGTRTLREITAPDVLGWQTKLIAKGLQPQTVNNAVSTLSSLFRLAVLERKVDYNPCGSLPRVPSVKKRPSFWTPAEAGKFLALARVEDFEVYQVALLAICSGLRPGEMMELRRKDLDFERGLVENCRHFCTKTRKPLDGLKNRDDGYRVPLPRSVLAVLEDKRRLPPEALVFPWLRHQRAFGWLRLKPLAEKAGVKYIGFHKFRHTFASHLVLAGHHPLKIRDLMGHKTVKSTEVYMHLVDETPYGATDCIAAGLGDAAFQGGSVVALKGGR